jgi:hypothetical protein
VGGALYLYSDRFVFVPHANNLASDRSPFSFPRNDISVRIVIHEIKNFQRWFLRTMPRVLEIACKGESNRFLVPQAERTCEKIKSILGKVEHRANYRAEIA